MNDNISCRKKGRRKRERCQRKGEVWGSQEKSVTVEKKKHIVKCIPHCSANVSDGGLNTSTVSGHQYNTPLEEKKGKKSEGTFCEY